MYRISRVSILIPILVVLFLTSLSCTYALAQPVQEVQYFYFFKKAEISSQENEGIYFLIFSDIRFTKKVKSVIVSISSKVAFDEGFDGDLYSVLGNISPAESQDFSARQYRIGSRLELYIFLSCLQFLIGLVLLVVGRRSCLQGASVLANSKNQVLRTGGIFYFMLVSLFVVFTLSVVAIPLSAVLLLLFFLLYIVGQVRLSIYIGYLLHNRFRIHKHLLLYYISGSLCIDFVKYFPVVGWFFGLIIIPIVCFGIVAQTFINLHLTKHYYTPRFGLSPKRSRNKKERIDAARQIILRK